MSRKTTTRDRYISKIVSDIATGKVLSRRTKKYGGPWAALMGVRFPSVASNTFVGPLPASNAEVIVCTTPPINLPLDGALILIVWSFSVVFGTATTFLNMRMRRGTTVGGVQVNAQVWGIVGAAGQQLSISGAYFDTPGIVAGQQYSLTCVQGTATGAGTSPDPFIMAFVL